MKSLKHVVRRFYALVLLLCAVALLGFLVKLVMTYASTPAKLREVRQGLRDERGQRAKQALRMERKFSEMLWYTQDEMYEICFAVYGYENNGQELIVVGFTQVTCTDAVIGAIQRRRAGEENWQ